MIHTDVCIVGAGIAGLSTAVQLAIRKPEWHILVVAKGTLDACNSDLAQGGIALFGDMESHIQDTLRVGGWHADPQKVREILRHIPEAIDMLASYGVQFDQAHNRPELILEGGHSEARIAHVKDHTGRSVMQCLREKCETYPNIHLLSRHTLVHLLTYTASGAEKKCLGCELLPEGGAHTEIVRSRATVLATGGIGAAFQRTTNTAHSLGEGLIAAYRAGAILEDMEFIQFHPTGLHLENNPHCTLISEAVRGAGARLRDLSGEAFMKKYHPQGDLAPRDIVSRAIYTEMLANRSNKVQLDCTEIDDFAVRFPSIYHACRTQGIDPTQSCIPVSPAQHFLCGGLRVDLFGRTSVEGLFASGECACTGLHGANRLASNSLLEGLIFSKNIADFIAQTPSTHDHGQQITFEEQEILPRDPASTLSEYMNEIRQVLHEEAGIVRTNYGLSLAKETLEEKAREIARLKPAGGLSAEWLEAHNLCELATRIIEACLQRKDNIGCHFNLNSDKADRAVLHPV